MSKLQTFHTLSEMEKVMHAFLSGRGDCCSALLSGLPKRVATLTAHWDLLQDRTAHYTTFKLPMRLPDGFHAHFKIDLASFKISPLKVIFLQMKCVFRITLPHIANWEPQSCLPGSHAQLPRGVSRQRIGRFCQQSSLWRWKWRRWWESPPVPKLPYNTTDSLLQHA